MGRPRLPGGPIVSGGRRRSLGAALTQSPLRFLALRDPEAEVDSRLRELVGIESLEDADRESVLDLLNSLRERFQGNWLTPDPGQKQRRPRAFVGLHRLAYERLADLDEDEWREDGSEDDDEGEDEDGPAAEDGIDVL